MTTKTAHFIYSRLLYYSRESVVEIFQDLHSFSDVHELIVEGIAFECDTFGEEKCFAVPFKLV